VDGMVAELEGERAEVREGGYRRVWVHRPGCWCLRVRVDKKEGPYRVAIFSGGAL
jgi:hypothetical protein